MNNASVEGTNITTGISPELQNAALLFGGGNATPNQQAAMNVANAAFFFSPDAAAGRRSRTP